ncbi:MAG: glucosamine-6-phosphate deaminase [Defluviitaleaceae bacterium]|nr:glucosamine-6-phosphate deaminase [Defluviitaleaceae bacterium]
MHSNIALIVVPDYDSIGRKSADIFEEALRQKPDGVFGFATGQTPEGLYAELARRHKESGLDFSKMGAFNLDEYYPIKKDDRQSYSRFMREKLFNEVNADPALLHIPDGEAADPALECARYDGLIEGSGGIGLQILGIGANGHIGFNEPSESFSVGASYVALTELTVKSNARFFENQAQVPRHAITMGIRSIMMAGRVMLLASGDQKAAILRDALLGPVTPLVPASALQLHRDVVVVADEAAASML